MEKIAQETVEKEAFFKLSYGLYVLCSGNNGCVINTVMQVTDKSPRILFAINSESCTASGLHVGDAVTVSVLTEDTPFSLIRHFGYQSGWKVDKLAGRQDPQDARGVPYLAEHSCAMIGAVVEAAIPCGTHTVYFAAVKEARTMSEQAPLTYADYFANVKPRAGASVAEKKGYVCTVCGYVYEGDHLPADYVCPVCHRGAEVFEPLEA